MSKAKELIQELNEAKSMTFGTFPPVKEVQKALDKIGGFDWNLKGSDARAAEKAGVDADSWDDAEEFIADMKKMMDKGGENGESLASDAMGILGFEWI